MIMLTHHKETYVTTKLIISNDDDCNNVGIYQVFMSTAYCLLSLVLLHCQNSDRFTTKCILLIQLPNEKDLCTTVLVLRFCTGRKPFLFQLE